METRFFLRLLPWMFIALLGCEGEGERACWSGAWRCEGESLLRCEAGAWVVAEECGAGGCLEGGCAEEGDLCAEVSCEGGQCVAQGICRCPEGLVDMAGECVPEEDPCEGVGCSHHGQCIAVEGEAVCLCDPGYQARRLQCEMVVSSMGEALPEPVGEMLALPEPEIEGGMGVREAIQTRRSKRLFTQEGIALEELSQLLWAAQGITSTTGKRSAPSAGSTYPFELFVLARKVSDLAGGLYQYVIGDHGLHLIREDTSVEGLSSSMAETADALLFLVGVIPRTAERYEHRAERYVLIEGGTIVENIHLQAVDLGLGTVCIGAFDDSSIQDFLGTDALPVAIMPVGLTLD